MSSSGLAERSSEFLAALSAAASETDRTNVIGDKVWQRFYASPLPLAPFSKTNGGDGLSEPKHYRELLNILRLIGSIDLSFGRLFEGHVNAVQLVTRYGNARQLNDLLKSVVQGQISGVWGADGARPLAVKTHADGDHELHGQKILASGAGLIRRPLVTASLAGVQTLYLLDLDQHHPADLRAWQPLGMKSTATGTMDLTGVEIGAAEQIGQPDDYTRQPTFSAGAWRFCAVHLGAIENLTDRYRDHLVSAKRDKDPYQRHRIAQCIASAKTARFWIEEAARRLALEEIDPDQIVAFSNLTRMVTERAALDTIEAVQRGIGLSAFMQAHPIERICRDLATYLRQPGPDHAMNDGARVFLETNASVGDF